MRHAGKVALGLALGLALVGCSDNPYDPNAPVIDPNAPRVHITSPKRGTIAGDIHTITVTGTVESKNQISSVTVDGVAASVAQDGTWTATVPVVPGTNLLHAIATDNQNMTGKESRAVVAGPMAKISTQVPNALTATLSAQTFTALGKAAGNFITGGDLSSMLQAGNPVLDLGGGPDCLYVQASITSFTVGGAQIALAPQPGGLWLDAELDNIDVGMHLQYAAACLDGSRDITVGASHVSVSGNLAVGLAAGNFDIHLDSPNVAITGFNVELGGIPGAIVDMLSLDTAMGPILGWATEKLVVPMLNKSLAGLDTTKTIDVMGTPVDVSVKPSAIDFSDQGGIVELDTSLRAHGDNLSPGFVFVPNTVPAMDLSHGFQLAVADDAANQLLASLWAAHGLDKVIDLKTGPYGEVGQLYDSVELSAAVPPFVDASGNALELTVGDLMATFRNGELTATEVAISAEVDLKVTNDASGAIRLDVGQPTTYIDVLDDSEGVSGANQLSNSQFEAISSFALSRIVAVGSGSVGAIPLPTLEGVAVTNLTVGEQAGYVVVDGTVQ
ncbi:MAG: hypothetical protein ACM31C_05305 [Acidobacteriota bacterium]